MDHEYTINDLCVLTELSARTIRFYVQNGLVPRPTGEKKGARYSRVHLERLLAIRKWQAAGLSLDRIREILSAPDNPDIPLKPRWPGMVEVWSHLHVADGVELQVEPSRAGLSPEELRAFVKAVMSAYETITKEKN
jgi:DNA-binding transcriptional MerR regulator